VKTLIEPFVSLTGWVGEAGISALMLNELRGFIADDLAASVVFHVPAGSRGKKITKTFGTPVAIPYQSAGQLGDLVVSTWSRGKRKAEFSQLTDYDYRVSIDGVNFWGLPVNELFTAQTIVMAGTQATQVCIMVEHDDEDWLMLSGMYAVREVQPEDAMLEVAANVQRQIDSLVGDTLAVGTLTAVLGAKSVTITEPVVGQGLAWIDRYSMVKISGGGNTEYHQIDSQNELTFTFLSTLDGVSLKHAYTAAAVTIYVPAKVGHFERSATIPSVTVWGMAPEQVLRSSDVEDVADPTRDDGSTTRRRADLASSYTLLIDCEARQAELLSLVSRAVRRFLGRGFAWINAQKVDFIWDMPAEHIEPDVPVEIVPKIQYSLVIEVAELREDRQAAAAAQAAEFTLTVKTEDDHG
jgi:hypothetical protein